MTRAFFNAMRAAAGKAKTPYKRRLAYLEGTGTQWVDTLVAANDMRKIELGAQILSFHYTYASGIVGANNNGSRSAGIASPAANKVAFCTYNSTTTINVDSVSDRIHDYLANFDTQEASFDGAIFTINKWSDFVEPNIPVYLFAFPAGATGSTRQGVCTSGRVSYCRLYDANMALVRDFIPVIDNSDVACLYDQVSGQFFYNSGTGTFNYGEV